MVVIAPDAGSRRALAECLADAGLVVAATGSTAGVLDGAPTDVIVLHVSRSASESRNVRALARRSPASKLVCVMRDPVWKAARSLLREGATAVVAEEELDATLEVAVRSAHAGQLTLPSRLRMEIAQPVLSVREKQMLAMVVMGFSNPEIARKLHVAESTVKSHLSSAFAKLGVRSRNEATALILDPATGLGTGILEISGSTRTEEAVEPNSHEMVPASAA